MTKDFTPIYIISRREEMSRAQKRKTSSKLKEIVKKAGYKKPFLSKEEIYKKGKILAKITIDEGWSSSGYFEKDYPECYEPEERYTIGMSIQFNVGGNDLEEKLKKKLDSWHSTKY
jgi:hypothetical protein